MSLARNVFILLTNPPRLHFPPNPAMADADLARAIALAMS